MNKYYQCSHNSIIFKPSFNYPLTDNMLKELEMYQELIFGTKFNQSVEKLPPNIILLSFGSEFNQEINNLPQNLKILYLSNNFNHPIDNLPSNLEILEVGINFNHPLDFLPIGLKELTINNTKYQYDLYNLPVTLDTIRISNNYRGRIGRECEVKFLEEF